VPEFRTTLLIQVSVGLLVFAALFAARKKNGR